MDCIGEDQTKTRPDVQRAQPSFWGQSFSYLLAGTILSRLLFALVLLLLARRIGPEQYGLLMSSFAVVWLTSPLFTLGLDNWLVSPGACPSRSIEFARNAWTCLFLKVIGGGIWVVILFLAARFLNWSIFPAQVMLLVGITVWMEEIQRTVQSAYKAILENRSNLFLMPMGQAVVLLAVGALAWRKVDHLNVYLMVWAGASLVSALLALWIFVRRFPEPRALRSFFLIFFKAFPFALSGSLSMIYGRADIAIVAASLGATAAGLYSPAVSVIDMIALVPTTGYFILLPLLNRAREHSEKAWRDTFRWALQLSVLGSLCLGLGVWMFAEPMVQMLYGAAFGVTGRILSILSGVLMARTLNLTLAAVLVALDYQPRRLIVQILATVLNIGATLWVLQRGGIQGVAWVFVFTEVFIGLGYLSLLRYKLGSQLILKVVGS